MRMKNPRKNRYFSFPINKWKRLETNSFHLIKTYSLIRLTYLSFRIFHWCNPLYMSKIWISPSHLHKPSILLGNCSFIYPILFMIVRASFIFIILWKWEVGLVHCWFICFSSILWSWMKTHNKIFKMIHTYICFLIIDTISSNNQFI